MLLIIKTKEASFFFCPVLIWEVWARPCPVILVSKFHIRSQHPGKPTSECTFILFLFFLLTWLKILRVILFLSLYFISTPYQTKTWARADVFYSPQFVFVSELMLGSLREVVIKTVLVWSNTLAAGLFVSTFLSAEDGEVRWRSKRCWWVLSILPGLWHLFHWRVFLSLKCTCVDTHSGTPRRKGMHSATLQLSNRLPIRPQKLADCDPSVLLSLNCSPIACSNEKLSCLQWLYMP